MKIGFVPNHEKYAIVNKISYDDYQDFCKNRIWDKLFVEAFFNGNLVETTSIELFHIINKGINSYKSYEKLPRGDWNHFNSSPVVNLRSRQTHVFAKLTKNKKENNCAIVKHFQ